MIFYRILKYLKLRKLYLLETKIMDTENLKNYVDIFARNYFQFLRLIGIFYDVIYSNSNEYRTRISILFYIIKLFIILDEFNLDKSMRIAMVLIDKD